MTRKRDQLCHVAALVAWMVVIAVLSGQAGSEDSMRNAISWMLRPLSPVLREPDVGAAIPDPAIWLLRKLLHMTEYGVLAFLAYRSISSFARTASPGVSERSAAGAFALSLSCSALDELHQASMPGRTGATGDVVIDVLGISAVLAVILTQRAGRGELVYRVLDVIGAVATLALAAPLMMSAAAAVSLNMGRPVLFRQRRLGRDERPFTLLKFRTMKPRYDGTGRALAPRERLTPTGRLLRQLSLDELPQLWNVLRGEMSLVGPRPLYAEYLPYYTERERRRHLVRPGLTGLAQVMGRNTAPWDERLELDVRYVESKSLSLDLRILMKTVGKVLARSDVLDAAVQGSLAEHRRGLPRDREALSKGGQA